MATEHIIYFLLNGQLTNFPFGTHQQDIVNVLGETDWIIPIKRKDKRPAVIKYDRVEFYFTTDNPQEFNGVMITYSQPADNNKLKMDYQDLKERLDYGQVKDYLKKNNIHFKEAVSEFDKESKTIETESRVTFYFDDDGNLQKFGRFL